MHYITPKDCIETLKVDSIEDIKISMLWQIAEQERPFAKNYYNEDSRRSPAKQETCVVNGKFGELVTMISLAKSGCKIVSGVLFSDNDGELPYGDGGIDLIVSKDGVDYKIQVKYCEGNNLNFYEKRQEDAIRDNFKNNVIVLICHSCWKNGHKRHILRRLNKKFFEANIKPSPYSYSYSYILTYNIPEFDYIF